MIEQQSGRFGNIVNTMSWPADRVEELSRRLSMVHRGRCERSNVAINGPAILATDKCISCERGNAV